ncbi:AAA family ATPase [Candidatus Gracilibacteria bacterium]|nr:AAA family ATPase [Candidatus Gracilibacteria bacterium]
MATEPAKTDASAAVNKAVPVVVPAPPATPAPAAAPAKKEDSAEKWVKPTGIPELDFVLDGGLPASSSILLSGDAGAGKTTLAMQWLCAGYSKFKENGIYITMTESTITLVRNLKKTSFYDVNYMASSDLTAENFETEIAARPGIHFVDLRQIMEGIGLMKAEYTYEDLDFLIDTLFKLFVKSDVKRVVLDSITAVAYLMKDEAMIRSFIFRFGKLISMSDSNIMLISEAKDEKDSVFGIEEFISDGVIRLKYGDPENNLPRTLNVKKSVVGIFWLNLFHMEFRKAG